MTDAPDPAIISDTLIGLLLLPFDVGHPGQAARGLWLPAASLAAYFSILDLGYGESRNRWLGSSWRRAGDRA